jgi:hypothetical protein
MRNDNRPLGVLLIAPFAMLLITGARLGQAHGYRRAFLASRPQPVASKAGSTELARSGR